MEEPCLSMDLLFLPPTFDYDQDNFILEDFQKDNLEAELAASFHDAQPELLQPTFTNSRNVLSNKVLPLKHHNFSIKNHLKTYYYRKKH